MIILFHILVIMFLLIAWPVSVLPFLVSGSLLRVNDQESQTFFYIGVIAQLILFIIFMVVFF